MLDNFETIEMKGKTYLLGVNINVLEEIQNRHGSLENWGSAIYKDGEPNLSEVKWSVLQFINEGIEISNEANGTNDPLLTEKQIGRLMNFSDCNAAVEKIFSALKNSTPEADEESESDPNVKTTQNTTES